MGEIGAGASALTGVSSRAVAYATYLFDLDGTLLDSVELIVASHRHTRSVHFGDVLPDARYVECMGRTLHDIYRDFAREAQRKDEEVLVATYRAYNLAHHDTMVRPYPGVLEALQRLARGGARMAVVTSKLRSLARRGLEVAGIDHFFPLIIGADDVERGKPDPWPVLHALKVLGADAQGAVMVGDSTHDLQAGRRAGVRTAAVAWGPFERAMLEAESPDHWVGEPAELWRIG